MSAIQTPEGWWPAALAPGVTCKSVLILAMAWAIARSLHRSTAAARHRVWSLALAGILASPLLSLVLPSWSWPVLAAPDVNTALEIRVAEGRVLSRPPDPIARERPGGRLSSAGRVEHATPGEHLVANGAGPESAVTQPSARRASSTIPWPAWLAILGAWWAGAAPLLAGPLIGQLVLRWTARRAQPIDQVEWAELLRALSAHLGLRRRVRLLRGSRAAMPMTWGWFRPVVMLPAEADAWLPERRRSVLLHELAHVHRLDCLTQYVAQVACALYWFNPLAWLAAHRMRVERERACDDLVLASGTRASDYAGDLLEMARGFHSGSRRGTGSRGDRAPLATGGPLARHP